MVLATLLVLCLLIEAHFPFKAQPSTALPHAHPTQGQPSLVLSIP